MTIVQLVEKYVDSSTVVIVLITFITISVCSRVFKAIWYDKALVGHGKRSALDSNPTHGRILELSKTEKACVRFSCEHSGSMKVGCILSLEGKRYLSKDLLAPALEAAQRRNPLLRCRTEKLNGEYVFIEDVSKAIDIVLVDNSRDWRTEWEEKISKEAMEIGDFHMKVYVWELPLDVQTSGVFRTHVLFTCGHAICDGVSLTEFALEVLRGACQIGKDDDKKAKDDDTNLLPNLEWSNSMDAMIDEELGGPFFAIPRVLKFLSKIVPNALFARRFEPAKPVLTMSRMAQDAHPKIHTFKLSQINTKRLLESCRKHGTTITGALGACMLDSLEDVLPHRPWNRRATVGVITDIRKMYSKPMGRSYLSYQASAIADFAHHMYQTRDKTNDLERIWGIACKFRQWITSRLNFCEPHPVSWISRYSLSWLPTRFMGTLYLTNFGNFPSVDGEFGEFVVVESYPLLNPCHSAIPYLLASTINGELSCTITAAVPCFEASQLETWKTAILSRLNLILS